MRVRGGQAYSASPKSQEEQEGGHAFQEAQGVGATRTDQESRMTGQRRGRARGAGR